MHKTVLISLKGFLFLSLVSLFLNTYAQKYSVPERTGWWKFDNASTLLKAEAGYGLNLVAVGSNTAVSGPSFENGAVRIGIGSYLKMSHQISANGGGTKVNEYTLQYDFKVPSIDVWHTFFQTNLSNSNDGEFFINPSGNIGVAAVGYATYNIIPGEWYRLLISVKNGTHFNFYLDGQLVLTGNAQNIDERFSLENQLLVFADDDSEDAEIICSELAIWNQALSSEQILELGGYGHIINPSPMTQIPYLQAQSSTSITISWHDIAASGTKVEHGLSPNLNFETTGTNELIGDLYRWHTVKLTGLLPDTRYFYRVLSGGKSSELYSFRTLPDSSFTGKLRFVLLSDTHATDTLMAGKILRAARDKIKELYGPDIENSIHGIFHSGDIVVSGSTLNHYTKQFFKPISALSTHIPTMVVAGNHELESPYFYQYLKLDDQSAFPTNPELNEKIWQTQIGNTLFIGLNTNIIDEYGETQLNWLNTRLSQAELDTSIDFIFIFFHHPPISELWIVGGTDYVKNSLLPIMKKYSKVQQINYGHTHGFERGTSNSEITDSDIRIICSGGSGGPLDPWKEGEVKDYNDVHICISNYFYQILEIDIANKSFQNSVYSLGTLNNPKDSELIDSWYKKKNQSKPEIPSISNIESFSTYYQFTTSTFSGVDSLMSVEYQVIDSTLQSPVVIDTLIHWKNIFGVDQNDNPVDLNKDVNLYQFKLYKALLSNEKRYLIRVRYRDHNLKWSPWSKMSKLTILGNSEYPNSNQGYRLEQNYPNPFHNQTTIIYHLPEKSDVKFRIYDINNNLIDEVYEGIKPEGTFYLNYSNRYMQASTYTYEMIANKFVASKKMISLK